MNNKQVCICHCHSEKDLPLGVQCRCIKNCEHCHPENFKEKEGQECPCHCHVLTEKPCSDHHDCEHCRQKLTPMQSYINALVSADFFKKRIIEKNKESWDSIEKSVREELQK